MREALPSSLAGRHAPLGGRQAAYPESRKGMAVPPPEVRGVNLSGFYTQGKRENELN